MPFLATKPFFNFSFYLNRIERKQHIHTGVMFRSLVSRPLMMSATGMNLFRIITRDEIKTISNAVTSKADDTKFVIFDVRTAEENANGTIPGAINIPVDEIGDVLAKTSPADFHTKYGIHKPVESDHTIVVFCHAGVRSKRSADIVEKLGYTDVLNFSGGWSEWNNAN